MNEEYLIKAVIFDLDGVIVSTDEYHYLAWKRLADETGLYFDREINAKLRGVSRLDSLNIILGRQAEMVPEKDKAELMDRKNLYYKEYLERLDEGAVTEEVARTLAALREDGILLAIGSSSKNAGFILEKIGYGGFFDAVADGNDVSRSKPDPEVFVLAAERLGVLYGDCLVVEDSDAGIEAALACGMRAAGIGYAAENCRADWKLRNLSDVLSCVKTG